MLFSPHFRTPDYKYSVSVEARDGVEENGKRPVSPRGVYEEPSEIDGGGTLAGESHHYASSDVAIGKSRKPPELSVPRKPTKAVMGALMGNAPPPKSDSLERPSLRKSSAQEQGDAIARGKQALRSLKLKSAASSDDTDGYENGPVSPPRSPTHSGQGHAVVHVHNRKQSGKTPRKPTRASPPPPAVKRSPTPPNVEPEYAEPPYDPEPPMPAPPRSASMPPGASANMTDQKTS